MTEKIFFVEHYQKARELITIEMEKHVDMYAPVFPAEDLFRKTLTDFVMGDGKRFRAALSFITAQAYGHTDPYPHTAVEVFHKYLLTHDDIIDKSPKRYGNLTVHARFAEAYKDSPDNGHIGHAMGIIAGDVMSTVSQHIITTANLSAERKIALLTCLIQATNEVTWGWYDQFVIDYLPLSSSKLSFERILDSLVWVTGKYTMTFPLRFGFLTAGKEYPSELDEAANALAIIFQTSDDLLGIFGDPEKTGKSNHDDLSQGKKTLPLWYTYELATPEQKKMLETSIGNTHLTTEEAQVVRDIVIRSGALEKTKQLMQHYRDVALASIARAPIPSDLQRFLVGFADYLQEREK